MFRLADVQLDILGLTVLSDNHTGVNLLARSDEQSTALLCGVQTVGNGLACLESDQGTLFAVFDVALVRCVIFKLGVQDTSSFGGGHEDSTETNQASCRDFELQTGGTIACAAHAVKLAFTLAEELDDSTGELIRNVNVCDFHWLEFASALVLFVDNLCLTYCELISLTAHVFDQDGQMQLTTAGYF